MINLQIVGHALLFMGSIKSGGIQLMETRKTDNRWTNTFKSFYWNRFSTCSQQFDVERVLYKPNFVSAVFCCCYLFRVCSCLELIEFPHWLLLILIFKSLSERVQAFVENWFNKWKVISIVFLFSATNLRITSGWCKPLSTLFIPAYAKSILEHKNGQNIY